MTKKTLIVTGSLLICAIVSLVSCAGKAVDSNGAAASGKSAVDKVFSAIKWLDTKNAAGSDCVMLTLAGKVIYFDPVDIELRSDRTWPKADAIFYTHSHADHYSLATALALSKADTTIVTCGDVAYQMQDAGLARVVTAVPPGSETEGVSAGELAGAAGEGAITFRTVPMYSVPESTGHAKVMEWVGYVVEGEGATLWFSGSSGPTPEVMALEGVDIALVAVTNGFTVDVPQTVELAKALKPAYLVPLHWNGSYDAEVKKLPGMMPAGTQCAILALE